MEEHSREHVPVAVLGRKLYARAKEIRYLRNTIEDVDGKHGNQLETGKRRDF